MYCPLLTLSCYLLVCAQVPILAAEMGSNIKVWLVICHVFGQRVFYGGRGRRQIGDRVEIGCFGTAGATEPNSLVQMVWLGEGYQLP